MLAKMVALQSDYDGEMWHDIHQFMVTMGYLYLVHRYLIGLNHAVWVCVLLAFLNTLMNPTEMLKPAIVVGLVSLVVYNLDACLDGCTRRWRRNPTTPESKDSK